MTLEQQLILLAHIQFTARHFIALRVTLEKLIELIAYSIGTAAPDADQIRNFLIKESTQKTLESEWETALWRSADRNQSWRLICLAVTADPEVAKRLLARRPPSPDCCAFCWQDEKGFTDALKPELDIYNNPVSGVHLHRQCSRPWHLMRALVARN
ncbi:hypothetical protein NVV94_05285 [Pseudomonas sp. LS1212]|uniref:hypothetical protein n=1 Tax=Pseudomonas sp. LS1212 TaxID=2972478 RepID=UPI00215CBD88|nr:hypothetical protein [Pseudomonas sp. LS1212]UVJ44997.1 hypothetical protein NVV94_05285 [Pseudomonas sp. LS1212]